MNSSIRPLVLKLGRRDVLSPEEVATLEAIALEPETVERQVHLVSEGDRPGYCTLLVSGFAARYKLLEDGSRQITAIHVAGDFVDLHSFPLKTLDHGITTLSPCLVVKVPHERLTEVTERYPHLTRLLWLNTLIDAAIHREWLVAMGRRTAVGHAAHLICEIYSLLEVVGLAHELRFEFPVTQIDLADILGLSSVHVNRVIQDLRARELITWKGAKVSILDWDGLVEVGEFDPTYLNLVNEPR